MGGITDNPYRWISLFRDGHTIEQSNIDSISHLMDYITGTEDSPKKHYLLWFRVTDGDNNFTVSFDKDGDAYIHTPDGRMFMTEFKIRSARLMFHRDDNGYNLGFGGINTCGDMDGKYIKIHRDGSYEVSSELPVDYDMIRL